eukprot:6211976-Pleurochrysis_carterae.AAC.1
MRGFDVRGFDLGAVARLTLRSGGGAGAWSCTLATQAAASTSLAELGGPQRASSSSCSRPGVYSKRLHSLPTGFRSRSAFFSLKRNRHVYFTSTLLRAILWVGVAPAAKTEKGRWRL